MNLKQWMVPGSAWDSENACRKLEASVTAHLSTKTIIIFVGYSFYIGLRNMRTYKDDGYGSQW